jgi:hypothetical protein
MADHRIICIVRSPPSPPHKHGHIVGVGIASGGGRQMLNVSDVYTLMANGERFYTKGQQSGHVASIEKYHCSQCIVDSLRSTRDAVKDNNLDYLPQCEGG